MQLNKRMLFTRQASKGFASIAIHVTPHAQRLCGMENR